MRIKHIYFVVLMFNRIKTNILCLLSCTDATPDEKTALFLRKIEQCCYLFDFSDPMSDLRAKEIKRAALNEILDYVSNYKGVISEPIYPEVVRMVSTGNRQEVVN